MRIWAVLTVIDAGGDNSMLSLFQFGALVEEVCLTVTFEVVSRTDFLYSLHPDRFLCSFSCGSILGYPGIIGPFSFSASTAWW